MPIEDEKYSKYSKINHDKCLISKKVMQHKTKIVKFETTNIKILNQLI